MSKRYFEDIELGEALEMGTYTVSRGEILDFAEQYDPQPFHVDTEAAAQSPFGELIASGLHTMAIKQRLSVDVMTRTGSVRLASAKRSFANPSIRATN